MVHISDKKWEILTVDALGCGRVVKWVAILVYELVDEMEYLMAYY